MPSIRERKEAAVLSYFEGKMTDRVKFYIEAANQDLLYGPRPSYDDDKFPYEGFIHARNIVREWWDAESESLLVTCDGEILNKDTDREAILDLHYSVEIEEYSISYIASIIFRRLHSYI